MGIIGIYDNSGPAYHRIFIPLSAMPGVDVRFTNFVEEQHLEGVKVIIFNRLFPGNKLSQILQWRKKYGFKLICDLDDHWDLDYNHILYQHYKEKNLSTYILQSLTVSDAVTVTHERLADAVLPYNRNVWVLPNAIDSEHRNFKVQHQPSAFTRLFWAGGITHEPDINILRNPIKRIASDVYLRNKTMMVMAGYMDGHPTWDRMASTYTNGLQLKGSILKGRQVNDYYALYEFADICLIPLVDSKFNRNKSNLKILEAANMCKPVIVSNVHPYKDFPQELVNYVDNQTDWYRNVRMLVRNDYFASGQGKALQQYCATNYNFDAINKVRWELIITI